MKIFKNIISIILAVIMFFSLIAIIYVKSIDNTFRDPENLAYRIVDATYQEKLYNDTYESIDSALGLVLINSSDFSDVLSKSVIEIESIKALTQTINIAYRTETEEYVFEDTDLYNRINEKLIDYSKEYDIEYSDSAASEVYDMVCNVVSSQLRLFSSKYVEKAAPYIDKVLKIGALWYIPVIVYGVCFIGIVLLGLKKIKEALYTIALPSFLASFFSAASAFIFLRKDYLSNSILGDSGIGYVLKRVYEIFFGELSTLSNTFTALFLILSIAIIVVRTIHVYNPEKKLTHHH